ncbi:Acetylcholinesterase [Psilocybe cubensis]|uniref:Acetylcholinesterase n=2 Tax=Psilocybe cubensis TaxID=181762 RepID=A0ACB8HDD0_PSICU|nr:Acetylcholinesterase [Psilocybe cubensis]KAH9485684.1 Acetylcholinesterase [Psilocybe cubensis]
MWGQNEVHSIIGFRMHFLQILSKSLLAIYHTVRVDVTATSDGLTVQTAQGPVSGTLVTPSVRQFLGIPYAVAQRWEAPNNPPNRTSVLKATNYSFTCPQNLSPIYKGILLVAGGQGIDVPESEDCLTVNIWAPSVKRQQKTAVLIWIYGGGFQFGSSNLPEYGGEHFVNDHDDITVVTFNYRMNIFGQPNSPQLANRTLTQNFGLLDINAAIHWVYANIGAFGGDPDRITIFGQSAGAFAVEAYTYAHLNDTIVKGAIEQSGNLGFATSGLLVSPAIDGTWNTLASKVGCGAVPDAAQLACMKAVPFRTLEDIIIQSGLTFNLLFDNITIFSDIPERAKAGKFLKVPLLGGSTANEGDILTVAAEVAGLSPPASPFVSEILSDVQTQVNFTCPAGSAAQDRVNAGVRTWRYQYQGVFPNISPRPDTRAYHLAEIPIIFGTYRTINPSILITPNEIALSKYMQGAWVAFARNPGRGLIDYGWPLYDATTNTTVVLGNFVNPTGMEFTKGTILDSTCGNITQLLDFAALVSSA